MKLYYSHRSPYVRLVMVVVHWGRLAPRIELMNTVVNMEAPLPGLMADNPLTKIPTLLLDDGQALFDSRVICEYLDALHAEPRLFPASGDARWQALRWLALGHGLTDLLLGWFAERNRPEDRRSPKLIEAFETKYRSTIRRMDAEMAALRATPFGIGHAAIGNVLSYSDFRFPALDWREHRALADWHAEYAAMPAVAADPFFDDVAAAAAR